MTPPLLTTAACHFRTGLTLVPQVCLKMHARWIHCNLNQLLCKAFVANFIGKNFLLTQGSSEPL